MVVGTKLKQVEEFDLFSTKTAQGPFSLSPGFDRQEGRLGVVCGLRLWREMREQEGGGGGSVVKAGASTRLAAAAAGGRMAGTHIHSHTGRQAHLTAQYH